MQKAFLQLDTDLVSLTVWLNMLGIVYLWNAPVSSGAKQSRLCCCLLQFKTVAGLLQGSLRAANRSTLSNLSAHAGIEHVLNLFLSFLRAGRFALFIPKFTSRRDKTAFSRAKRQPCGLSGRLNTSRFKSPSKNGPHLWKWSIALI